jgi:hypothetical protein
VTVRVRLVLDPGVMVVFPTVVEHPPDDAVVILVAFLVSENESRWWLLSSLL